MGTGPVPEDQRIPLDRLREPLVGACGCQAAIPHFYITHTYDVEMLLSLRTQANALVSMKRNYRSRFVVKAVALTFASSPI